ncbi:resuscitation-promoting factor [Actinomadura flavalba]|uniref:resuscitation-promoting factor n=1 Tax=Actinomadura flavalba TaxID=1120938 RepID=UPI001F0A2FFB|nr:resuscitation-promoting factor [Actinomadura flavalba]
MTRKTTLRRPTTTLVPRVLLAAALVAGTAGACGGGDEPAKTRRAADAPAADPAAAPSSPAPEPRQVAIIIDRKRTEKTVTGTTVAQVLDQAGVKLGKYDLVEPARDEPAEAKITITRLLSKPVVKGVRTTLPVVKKKDRKLPPFSQKEVRAGKPGLTIVKTAWAKRKGKKVKIVLAEKVKRKPVAQILAIGPSAGGGPASGLNWAGLAKCESGGRPNAVNPAGYYGLYQFSLPTWRSVGGSGLPSQAPAAEQTYRAQLLYKKVGGRWQGQWPHCGKFLFS